MDSLTDWERRIVGLVQSATFPQSAKTTWALKSNWRGEGMLKFQAYDLPLDVQCSDEQSRPFSVLFGLPDFAYDKHTRVGTRVCAALARQLGPFFAQFPIAEGETADRAIGLALFYVEGGFIPNRMFDPRLDTLEMKLEAAQFGWPLQTWLQLLMEVNGALYRSGTVNRLRADVLARKGYPDGELA